MTKPAARLGDRCEGTCIHPSHIPPIFTQGTITEGSPNSSVNGQAQSRVGDTGITDCGHSFFLKEGSASSSLNGKEPCRVGDPTDGNLQGVIISGSPDTTIAD